MGRRGSDNQAANCSAYQKMVFHCSVYVGSGCFRRQSYPGVCGLAVTGSQWRDQGSERSEGGQGQWNALKIIFCSYQRHVFPTHILNVLELITLESKIAVSVFWAPRKADSGSGSWIGLTRDQTWGGSQRPRCLLLTSFFSPVMLFLLPSCRCHLGALFMPIPLPLLNKSSKQTQITADLWMC